MASLAVVLLLGLAGCTSDGASDGVAQHCEPGDDVVAFNQGDEAKIEGSSIVSVTGAGSRKVRNVTGNWVATEPSFSPDGRTLVVVRANGDYESAGPEATSLWLVGVHGEHPRPLTDGHYDESPTWSPDGRTIAFTRNQAGDDGAYRQSIASVPSSGGEVTTVLADQRSWAVAWSPVDDRLAFVVDEYDESDLETVASSVWTVRADGTERQKVVDLPGLQPTELFWDPSGEAVWLSGSSNQGGLWRVGLADGDVQMVDQHTSRGGWSQDGQRLYVIRRLRGDGDFTLSAAEVIDGRLKIESDLGPAGDGYPYSYYGLDVGPCLPDGLPPAKDDLGPDLPLEATRWRDGALALLVEQTDGVCEGRSCSQRLSTAISGNDQSIIFEVMVTDETITATSSNRTYEPNADFCYDATDYFLTDVAARYRIEGDQLHLARDGCDDLVLVAEGGR
ncbi:MAG: hypothetical protein ABI239_06145 [Aquihabitans sp.]